MLRCEGADSFRSGRGSRLNGFGGFHHPGQKSNLSRHRPLEEGAGDKEPVDLVRPLDDPIDPHIPVETLHGVTLDIAVSTMDLEGLVGDPADRLAAIDLGDGAFDRVLFDPLLVDPVVVWRSLFDRCESAVQQPCDPVHDRLGTEDVGHTVGDFLPDRPEGGDGDTELPPRICVSRPFRKCDLGDPHA